jgi:hypothetical protein
MRVTTSLKERMYKDLKEYKEWMDASERVIFEKCISHFNGVD